MKIHKDTKLKLKQISKGYRIMLSESLESGAGADSYLAEQIRRVDLTQENYSKFLIMKKDIEMLLIKGSSNNKYFRGQLKDVNFRINRIEQDAKEVYDKMKNTHIVDELEMI